MGGKRWQEEELDVIRKHYFDSPQKYILGLIPNRTWASINTQAWKMGIKRKFSIEPISEETRRKISSSNTGKRRTIETRQRISNSLKGNTNALGRILSEETKRKIGDAQLGEKNHAYGKHHTEEWKKHISELMRGRTHLPETRAKISKSKTGKKRGPMSVEWRNKISLGNKGKVVSKETREKLRIANKGRVPWCKGLTNKTDERLARRSEKLKATIRERFKNDPAATEHLKKIGVKGREEARKYRWMKPSRPQKQLYDLVKDSYPSELIEMEYTVPGINGRYFYIDVAIPKLKLGFEYDEATFHGSVWGNKEKDARRHKIIESQGWKLIHYTNLDNFTKA